MTETGKHSNKNHEPHLWVKDMKEETSIRGLYMAREKKMGLTRKGDPFLSITLADRTGDVEARVWERAEDYSALFSEGDILDVKGRTSSYRNKIQVIISKLKVAEDGWDPGIFLETAAMDSSEMMKSLIDILKGVKNPHLKALVDRFIADHDFISLLKTAPAAKTFHHGYPGGLLEHTLSVCRMSGHVADHYEELDRDLLLTGAFLHDIGKIREFRSNTRIDYSDEGRLLGHLVLGVAMVDEKLATLKNFPQELALRLKHIIISHHGQYEFGSPKRPKFLEAFALHLIDDLDAKMNGLSRFMKRDRQEGAWTDFNRLFDRYFLKGDIPVTMEKAEPPLSGGGRQTVLFPS